MRTPIDAMSRNIGYALRVLTRTPGLTLTVVLTLALGIGASSAVFTAVNAVLLEPLPFPDADRLVSVRQTRERATVANVAPVRLEEWNERNSTFEALTGYTTQNTADTSADIPESIRTAGVSPRLKSFTTRTTSSSVMEGRRFVFSIPRVQFPAPRRKPLK